ncbi:MAG: c-type cytochrome [Deltaproteobacteria bacterium]|nr:c-type cytochrome [Deltaproteobacteria bacterium]
MQWALLGALAWAGCARSAPQAAAQTVSTQTAQTVSTQAASTQTSSAQTASAQAGGTSAAEKLNPRLLRRFKSLRGVLAAGPEPTDEQVQLGRMLYADKRLSRDRDVSCASCHVLTKYGVDNAQTSVGEKGAHGTRNSPTVYNAAGHFVQFWDGRASTVEEQAGGPIVNPLEMAMPSGDAAVAVLKTIPGYVAAFEKAFPQESDPMTFKTVGRAIGAFERKLVTPARWDRFLDGDKTALTDREVEGLRVFSDVGCLVCHTGEFLGGSMFQKVGSAVAWPNQKDQGRFTLTKNPADKMVFKVPGLRNVAMTAPYFHDGSAKTLSEAVTLMGKHQLNLDLTDDEVSAVVAWLGSLTGELPKEFLTAPVLPPDGPTTMNVAPEGHRAN